MDRASSLVMDFCDNIYVKNDTLSGFATSVEVTSLFADSSSVTFWNRHNVIFRTANALWIATLTCILELHNFQSMHCPTSICLYANVTK